MRTTPLFRRRAQLSVAKSYLRRVNQQFSDDFVEVPPSRWPPSNSPPDAVLRSKGFLVQVFSERHGAIRLTVCRTMVDANGEWSANITWEELQQIKNAVGFEECDAVEIYPRNQDVVNVANMRHLWVLSEPLRFAWRNRTFVCDQSS